MQFSGKPVDDINIALIATEIKLQWIISVEISKLLVRMLLPPWMSLSLEYCPRVSVISLGVIQGKLASNTRETCDVFGFG